MLVPKGDADVGPAVAYGGVDMLLLGYSNTDIIVWAVKTGKKDKTEDKGQAGHTVKRGIFEPVRMNSHMAYRIGIMWDSAGALLWFVDAALVAIVKCQ